MKKIFLALSGFLLIPKISLAHCPLCVAGAGFLAVLAASLGVSTVVVGIFIGAFSLALGFWVAKMIKKKYFQAQDALVIAVIFLSTVWPIMPFIVHYGPFYVPFIGEYGTTYTINLFVLGSIIGALLLFVAPYASKFLTQKTGKRIPYQGLIMTFILLVIAALIAQFWV